MNTSPLTNLFHVSNLFNRSHKPKGDSMSTEELRQLFPEITDEEIAVRQASLVDSKKQSLRDQIANKDSEKAALEAELAALEPAEVAETPAEEVAETPAEEAAEEPQG